jgi:hypothetical protein
MKNQISILFSKKLLTNIILYLIIMITTKQKERKQMNIGYKLFEMDMRDGKLYPLFIGKTKAFELDKWIHAEFIPTKGYACRGGLHLGLIPSAPHLIGADGTYSSRRGKNFKRIWVEVEYNDNNNYNDYVQTLPKKCITDGIPEDGFYNFKEANGALWIITSDIKINRILTEEERQAMLESIGFDEKKAIEKRVEILNKYKKTLDK